MKIDLAPFQSLIRARCGLLFEGDSGEEKLAATLKDRMAAIGQSQPGDYYAHLFGHEDEFQELINLLTINETYFFREPEQIRLLVEKLVPRLLARGIKPVRILSAGCSSGEEPYSLAMALHERYGDSVHSLFSFIGGDIDSQVLAKARNATYAEFSFRGVAAERRERHFERQHWGWRLKEHLRGAVSFHELNLLAREFPAVFRACDVIFYRNVSIYFDQPTRRLIQQNLASLLKDDGFLIIGTAETLANDLGVLPLIEEDGLFYFVKGAPPLAEAAAPRAVPAFALPSPHPLPPTAALPAGGTAARAPVPDPLMPSGPWTQTQLRAEGTRPLALGLNRPAEPQAPATLPELAAAREALRDKRFEAARAMLRAPPRRRCRRARRAAVDGASDDRAQGIRPRRGTGAAGHRPRGLVHRRLPAARSGLQVAGSGRAGGALVQTGRLCSP